MGLNRYWKMIREKDMFGYLITLNFNRRGQFHKTQIGGLVSMGIKIFINIYIILNFTTLFTYGDNKNGTLIGFEEVMDQGKVMVNNTELLVYFVLRNQDAMSALWLKDAPEYVDIYFQQANDDWLKVSGKNTQSVSRIEAR